MNETEIRNAAEHERDTLRKQADREYLARLDEANRLLRESLEHIDSVYALRLTVLYPAV